MFQFKLELRDSVNGASFETLTLLTCNLFQSLKSYQIFCNFELCVYQNVIMEKKKKKKHGNKKVGWKLTHLDVCRSKVSMTKVLSSLEWRMRRCCIVPSGDVKWRTLSAYLTVSTLINAWYHDKGCESIFERGGSISVNNLTSAKLWSSWSSVYVKAVNWKKSESGYLYCIQF